MKPTISGVYKRIKQDVTVILGKNGQGYYFFASVIGVSENFVRAHPITFEESERFVLIPKGDITMNFYVQIILDENERISTREGLSDLIRQVERDTGEIYTFEGGLPYLTIHDDLDYKREKIEEEVWCAITQMIRT